MLLVRHGQASWGSDDYDVLSETGWEQSRLLGRALAARGIVPDVAIIGGMRRHRETAEACLAELQGDPDPLIDRDWDEFDHVSMLAKLRPPFEGREPTKAEFQEWFEAATDRWTGGAYDDDYTEPFTVFTDRVGEALRRTAEAAASGTAIVFSSGGPIAWATASLLTDDPAAASPLWRKLNPVCVNSGVTRLVTGRRGTTLVSFNEHAHLDGVPDLLTYR
ncbi:MAG: histidine phosphatase family protein [Marmoricola sp.]